MTKADLSTLGHLAIMLIRLIEREEAKSAASAIPQPGSRAHRALRRLPPVRLAEIEADLFDHGGTLDEVTVKLFRERVLGPMSYKAIRAALWRWKKTRQAEQRISAVPKETQFPGRSQPGVRPEVEGIESESPRECASPPEEVRP